MRRENRKLLLAYVQKRELSKEERIHGVLALFGVVLIQAVVEKGYEYMGPSVPGYLVRGTVRNLARRHRYEYVARYASFELGNLLNSPIPVVSDFIAAAQEEEGSQMATLLGLRGMFDLLKTTPDDVFGRRATTNQKQLMLIHVLLGKWNATA